VITTPFGAHSTAADVIAGIELSGKRAIVTGASSGIGSETARSLAGAGADVTLAVRDTAAGATIAADMAGACNEAPVVDAADAESTGVATYALDPTNAERLWNLSLATLL
jgi:NAD(P)-dependent dehydrogenase (short-subunit alcohol dehydrogenase family)